LLLHAPHARRTPAHPPTQIATSITITTRTATIMAPWSKKNPPAAAAAAQQAATPAAAAAADGLVALSCCANPANPAAAAAPSLASTSADGSHHAIECVFASGAATVPATYDPEARVYTCRAPAAVASLPYDVVADGGKVVLQRGCPANCPPPGTDSVPPPAATSVLGRMTWLDRLLPLWILLAMAAGILLGVFAPSARDAFGAGAVHIGEVPLPLAIGLWMMMLPVLTKVRYELLGPLLFQRAVAKQLGVSMFLNWVLGPALMTALAWACLPDLPEYRSGVIMVGMARCIAMVLIWNDLSGGHAELCAVTVAVNSVLQIVLYAPLSMLYLGPSVLGAGVGGFWLVAKSVLLFLGLPLGAALILRYTVLALASRRFLETKIMPYFGPVALLALLYTIVALFAAQGDRIVSEIGAICRVAVPMLIYFFAQWALGVAAAWYTHAPYSYAATQAFTAASNNFELGIAVAVGVWGAKSPQALAATVGPLVEVPVLVALVYVSLWVQRRWYGKRDAELVATGKMPKDIHEIIEESEKKREEARAAKKAKNEEAALRQRQAGGVELPRPAA
jgi:ACR3 family arsenite transporter